MSLELWRHELRLVIRQRVAAPALLLLALLSAAAVWAGLAEIHRQQQTIARIQPQQAADEAAVAAWVSREGDAGSAAYYTFHATWDPPSTLAFAAIGQRDVSPWLLRVRALGLEAQLYEGEYYNAELALPGRFDWAFVLVYLAPLFAIVLLHDLRSGEREAGRIGLLAATARDLRSLWWRRASLRFGLLAIALCIPFLAGALRAGTGFAQALAVTGIALAYLAFWVATCIFVGRREGGSLTHAATLIAAWLVLTLVLPALAHLAISSAIPVQQGVELTLAQREIVHGAWDRPKEETMQAFFRSHPEWRDTPPIAGGFHYKWYYAFHQVGDERVASQAAAYRNGLLARDRWTRFTAFALPAVAVQTGVHRMARTDLEAQLDYQQRIRTFHAQLRRFYYPYVFNDVPFREADFARAPRWGSD